jgi:hypothetical protein
MEHVTLSPVLVLFWASTAGQRSATGPSIVVCWPIATRPYEVSHEAAAKRRQPLAQRSANTARRGPGSKT